MGGAKVQDLLFPKTGSWTGSYKELAVKVSVPAGATVKVVFEAGGVATNLDYLVFTP